MNASHYVELAVFVGLLAATTKPLGLYLKKVFSGENTFLSPLLKPLEQALYRLSGLRVVEEQSWQKYAIDLLTFSAVSFVFTYVLLRLQHVLILNPEHLPEISWHLALNTTVSFLTNTNWQSYGGESTLSYFSQMVALTFHNFISAAVGLAVAVAVLRGVGRKESAGIGNFWADLVRANLYVLLPLSVILAIFLLSQGVVQNFHHYTEVMTLEGVKQIIAQGPVASQVAIKMIGTNGGGFFGANAAHPFENPTALSNFFQMLAIFLIPSALVYLLGASVGHLKHAWSVWAAMLIVFLIGVGVVAHYEFAGNPALSRLGASSSFNMEGKETRFGIFESSLFATVTTDASCGAVNSMHDSFTPLAGGMVLVNILLGEIIFGGVGSGLYGMILFILLTVFIAGLMVGRTPEYLGKKIEGREIKFAMLAVVTMAFSILGLSAVAVLHSEGLKALSNPNAHGFSQIFYAYSSATGNNGSALAGLSTNTAFWNVTLALAMFFGRYFVMIPMLAVAGTLGLKKPRPVSDSSFPIHGPMFVTLLLGVIFIVGALTFLPALSLGPIVEHFQMSQGQSFK